MIRSTCLIFAALLALAPLGDAQARPAETAAILAVVFLDDSTEGAYNGVRADETARLAKFEDQLEAAFAAQGYRLVDRAPVQADLDRVQNPAHCNNCDARAAEKLGADLAVTAEVQKISNLILTMNVFVREAGSGDLLRVGNADIRSNTDRSWERGLDYVLENRIFTGGVIEVD